METRMNNRSFSVCMNVYHKDDPAWFRMAVNSVLEQTVKPDEVVLVVDGPVGAELNAVIRDFEELACFKVVRLETNQGLGTARRIGMEHCSHELVAMMDADDLSVPDRFERQLAVFEQDDTLSIVGGQIAEFHNTVDQIVGIRTVTLTDGEIKKDLKQRCPFNHVTVMVKKQDVLRAGGYQHWYCNEDYYLWIRMYLTDLKFANVSEILVNVRIGDEMYQRRGGWNYFVSELGIQNLMLKESVIGIGTYLINVAKRLAVQVLMPNWIRGIVFKKFARKQTLEKQKI